MRCWGLCCAMVLGCAGGDDFTSSTAVLGGTSDPSTGGGQDASGPGSGATPTPSPSGPTTGEPSDTTDSSDAEGSAGSTSAAPGCVNNAECDDGNACTSNVCGDDGTCINQDISATCDDGDVCTVDSCSAAQGCVYTGASVDGSQTFDFTGDVQLFDVPDCVTVLTVEAYGAQGGDGDGIAVGGLGGFAQADVTVTPGESLEVHVGGAGSTVIGAATGGWGGGGGVVDAVGQGNGDSGTGGGASDVRRGALLDGRLVVAGGGGGGGWSVHTGFGGGGGGLSGEDGNSSTADRQPGGGGTQVAGGSVGWTEGVYLNEPGSFGQGGTAYHDGAGCGAGGGGWYGGGTGGFAGGGGGSSYVDAPGNENTMTSAGIQAGNGTITIRW